MAAPNGNQFWKLRLKHGRDSAIATPQELWDNFCEYAEWLQDNPLIEIDYRGKDADMVEFPKMRPMTKEGFALACGLSGWEIINRYRERSNDFNEVITRIERLIYNQKFEGAATGFFNANIIARDLGLKESSEVSGPNGGPVENKWVVEVKGVESDNG